MVARGKFREDLYMLEHTNGMQSWQEGATEIRGMNRSTLYDRLKKLEIL